MRIRTFLFIAALGLYLPGCHEGEPPNDGPESPAPAQASGQLRAVASPVKAGETAEISIRQEGKGGLVAFQGDFELPANARLVSAEIGTDAARAGLQLHHAVQPDGKVRVLGVSFDRIELIEGNELAVLHVEIANDMPSGTASIGISNVVVSDADGQNLGYVGSDHNLLEIR